MKPPPCVSSHPSLPTSVALHSISSAPSARPRGKGEYLVTDPVIDPEIAEHFDAWVREKRPWQQQCPLCKSEIWKFIRHPFVLPLEGMPDEQLRLLALICGNCGHVRLTDAATVRGERK